VSGDVKRVSELLSPEVRRQPTSGSIRTPHPRIDDLAEYDAIVVGTGTPFGRVLSQIASFLDQAVSHWAKGALHGNVGGTFASATRHGGQETTLFTIITDLLHFGVRVIGLNCGFADRMKVDEITGGAPYAATTIAGTNAQGQPSQNALAARVRGTGHRGDRRETPPLRDQNAARRWPRRRRNLAERVLASVEEKAGDPDCMEPAEQDLLVELRRARRSLRLQDMDEPAAVACVTPGHRIADAVATVMGSWSFIIVQSAILFVWITANLVGAIRGWDPYPFILLNLALSFQSAYAAPIIMMSQNRQQDIDRRAVENDYRINVKAELEIELLHDKIDQLREREILKLTEAVRMLTELLEQSASRPRESVAEGGRPS
jgi:NAD(P)H:quinone oxidoreductase type IV